MLRYPNPIFCNSLKKKIKQINKTQARKLYEAGKQFICFPAFAGWMVCGFLHIPLIRNTLYGGATHLRVMFSVSPTITAAQNWVNIRYSSKK